MFNQESINLFVKKFNIFFRTKMEIVIKREQKNYDLLNTFLTIFSPDKIPSLALEDYCFAKGNKNTMCYWIDNTLNDLGDIHINGQCGFQKFGIQNINGEYVFKRSNQTKCKYGDNAEDVYKTINSELIKVIAAAIAFNADEIDKSMLPQVFKSKLSYLYNKDHWMPIYVNTDVDKLLDVFEIPYYHSESLTKKRVKLYCFYLEVKKQIPFITTWEFMNFVYSVDGYRDYLRNGKPVNHSSANAEIRMSGPDDSTINSQDSEEDELDLSDEDLIEFVGTYTKNGAIDNGVTASRKKRNTPRKTDYQRKQKNNERKGTIGEKLIYNDEVSKIANLNLNLEVIHNAANDDTLGYDITSYDEKGKEIFIEVKTTTSGRIDGFHLSVKEVEKAIELGERFKLYRVYNLNVKNKTYDVEIFNGVELFETFKLKETSFIALIN